MSGRLASRQTALSQLRSGWLNAGGSLSDEGYQKELAAAQDYYAAEDQLRGDWLAGAKKGWAEFEDSATDVYAQVSDLSKSAFTGMSTQLADFLTTGKSDFKDFLSTFLKGIVQMISQLLILKTLKSSLGGTAFGSVLGFAGGGFVPEYDGGGYTGDGGKYEPKGVVHGGEFVFTKESTARIGKDNLYRLMRGYATGGYVGNQSSSSSGVIGGISVYAPVSLSQTGTETSGVGTANATGTAKQLQGIIQTTITERLKKEVSPGGLLYKKT
jgi:lambda family phage tail tape measure protein